MMEKLYAGRSEETMEKTKGYCDKCRKPLYHDNEIYCIILDQPKPLLQGIVSPNEKMRLCRNCYWGVVGIIKKSIFGLDNRL